MLRLVRCHQWLLLLLHCLLPDIIIVNHCTSSSSSTSTMVHSGILLFCINIHQLNWVQKKLCITTVYSQWNPLHWIQTITQVYR